MCAFFAEFGENGAQRAARRRFSLFLILDVQLVGAGIARPWPWAATAKLPGGYGIRPYAVGVDARRRPGRAAAAARPPLQSEAFFRVVM